MYSDSSRAEMRTDTRTAPRVPLMSIKPLGPVAAGFSTRAGATDGVGEAAGFAAAGDGVAAGSDAFALILNAAAFCAGGICDSLTLGGGG
jgi:hypothetical protein